MIIVLQLTMHSVWNSSRVLVWPVAQLPGTSANRSDPVVTEEVSMAAYSIPKSSVALSPRPPGQSLGRRSPGES